MGGYTYKKLPQDVEDTVTGNPADRDHARLCVFLFLGFLIIFSFGFTGFLLGQTFRTCHNTSTMYELEGAFPVVQEASDNKAEFFVGGLTVNVELTGLGGDAPLEGDCYCTFVNGTALLQDADAYSDVKASLQAGRCFRFVQALKWQTEGHVLYRIVDMETSQNGWVMKDFLKRKRMCDLPVRRKENFDLGPKFASGPVQQHCLQCICNLESNCKPIGCRMDVGSLSCGYFQIKNSYWTDCGKPGDSLKSCGDDTYCSSLCVQRYMTRYVRSSGCPDCCETYAREHNGGPRGCKNPNTLGYWQKLIRQKGCQFPPN